MLTINILHLIKNKTIPIKYLVNSINKYQRNKYIHNMLDTNIIEILNLLNSLSVIYLYLHKYSSLHQKILLSTNYIYNISMLKSIATTTTNYYIYNTIYSEIFSNWNLLKKKLIIYKWLRYFFLTKLASNNNYKKTFFINYTLYLLYIKLKLKYHGLKNLHAFPNTLIFIVLDNNKFLKEILHLNKNIILISNSSNTLKHLWSLNIIKLLINSKNFVLLNFILEIINTAIFHGILN